MILAKGPWSYIKKDGNHNHCGFFQLLGFSLGLRETLVPSEFSFYKAFFPLSPSPHSCPFCQNLLSRKVLRADGSELMLCSFGLDPAQVLSDWHLITGRQAGDRGLPPTLKARISLPALCPATGILELACLLNWILGLALVSQFPDGARVLPKAQPIRLLFCHCLELASSWPWAGQRPLAMSYKS